jgi:hypothetical protein
MLTLEKLGGSTVSDELKPSSGLQAGESCWQIDADDKLFCSFSSAHFEALIGRDNGYFPTIEDRNGGWNVVRTHCHSYRSDGFWNKSDQIENKDNP